MLSPRNFMEAAWEMRVEKAQVRAQSARIVTTGAVFEIDATKGRIVCRARLPRPRRVLTAQVAPTRLTGMRVAAEGSGAIIIHADRGGTTLRVNSDSLLHISARRGAEVTLHCHIAPELRSVWLANLMRLDPQGGFGAHVIGDGALRETPRGAIFFLQPADVMLVGVFPPKPYPQKRADEEVVVCHPPVSVKHPYWERPEMEEIARWGKVLLPANEMQWWKHWNMEFEPRDSRRWARTIRWAHELGMRIFVYASPFYFYRGSRYEPWADQYPEAMIIPGVADGQNVEVYLAEIKRLLADKEIAPDGLYFDGLYLGSIARSYYLVRKAREILGDDRMLMLHTTGNPPGAGYVKGWCPFLYCPFIDTWGDYNFRGEAQEGRYLEPEYLRYFISGYNISNTIGLLCNNGDPTLTRELVEQVLAAQARLMIFSPPGPGNAKLLRELYFPRLRAIEGVATLPKGQRRIEADLSLAPGDGFGIVPNRLAGAAERS
jgi:hypothetical protein